MWLATKRVAISPLSGVLGGPSWPKLAQVGPTQLVGPAKLANQLTLLCAKTIGVKHSVFFPTSGKSEEWHAESWRVSK